MSKFPLHIPTFDRPAATELARSLFPFISRNMRLWADTDSTHGGLAAWRDEEGRNRWSPDLPQRPRLVHHQLTGFGLMLSFKHAGVVRRIPADLVLWQLRDGRPIPRGHLIEHANGNLRDNSAGNLVLVRQAQNVAA